MKIGKYEKALKDYSKALELDSNYQLAKENMQTVYTKMKSSGE